ncbi:MAG: GNAT family N-acetyltransferase [Chloroflexota bacterium]|nr:GNAT family N-acetyltransferase [Chloroflexota bacterium]
MKAREVCPDDWLVIKMLNQKADRALPQLWRWEEHLTSNLFIIVEQRGSVVGALFAWPDESPVAWVRLAVLDDEWNVDEWLSLVLPPVLDGLCRHGAQELAWMDYGGWAGPHLEARGFTPLTEVITLVKSDSILPRANATSAHVRPASDADIPSIVALDRAAFTPHWRHSEVIMRRRAAISPHFAVATVASKVVGYAEGELRLPTAHLNRIAVYPAHQGHGVGALLLRATMHNFWQYGARQVTLNTQSNNRRSQQLYRRFGFGPVGDPIIAWNLRF